MWHYNHTVLLFAKYMKHAKMSVPLPPKCKLLLKFPATPIFTLILLLYTCSSIIYEWRVKIYLQRSWNYLVNRWFYFFINIPKTLNWQFLQLDLEFSSIQRKSFCRFIPIWRRPIWMVVFTNQVFTKNLQLLYSSVPYSTPPFPNP